MSNTVSKLNVKNDSVPTFLAERIVGLSQKDIERMNESSPYYLMRDEMLFHKKCGIEIGTHTTIELLDEGQKSRKTLVNTYVYKACEYDDVSIKMKLIGFDVKLLNQPLTPIQ